jgi:hypothetical protein
MDEWKKIGENEGELDLKNFILSVRGSPNDARVIRKSPSKSPPYSGISTDLKRALQDIFKKSPKDKEVGGVVADRRKVIKLVTGDAHEVMLPQDLEQFDIHWHTHPDNHFKMYLLLSGPDVYEAIRQFFSRQAKYASSHTSLVLHRKALISLKVTSTSQKENVDVQATIAEIQKFADAYEQMLLQFHGECIEISPYLHRDSPIADVQFTYMQTSSKKVNSLLNSTLKNFQLLKHLELLLTMEPWSEDIIVQSFSRVR